MGGGNGQKSAAARTKNQAKLAKNAKGGGGKAGPVAMHKCKRCMQTFAIFSTKESDLVEHCTNKHPAQDFAFSFPNFAKDKAGEVKGPNVKAAQDGPMVKKKKFKKKG